VDEENCSEDGSRRDAENKGNSGGCAARPAAHFDDTRRKKVFGFHD